jgi:hypothetical protein
MQSSPGRPKPKRLTRQQALAKVSDVMAQNKTRELPGTYNPLIIADLFQEQSHPWAAITEAMVAEVVSVARELVITVVEHVADAVTGGGIVELAMASVDQFETDLRAKVEELLSPHRDGHPITYNHYLTETVQAIQRKRLEKRMVDVLTLELNKVVDSIQYRNKGHQDVGSNARAIAQLVLGSSELDMDKYACNLALDMMQSYYKVSFQL